MSSVEVLELKGELRLAQLEILRLRKKLILDDSSDEIPDLN